MELLDFTNSQWLYEDICDECAVGAMKLVGLGDGEEKHRVCADCLRKALEMMEPTGRPETFALGAIAQALAEKP